MRQIKLVAVIAGVLSCSLAHTDVAQAGDVYRYVDERGNAIFTDKPIPGATRVATGAQRPPEEDERQYAEQQAANNSQLAAANQRVAASQENQRAAATVAKDLEASRAERCKKAQERYQAVITSPRLYREKEGGEREYLSDAELTQTRVDALKAMEMVCGKQG
jgi:hypothetical protein